MHVKRVLAVAFVGAFTWLFMSENVVAQAKRAKRDFKAFDTDNDGRISPNEWRVYAQTREIAPQESRNRFRAIDLDGDGYLSSDEVTKWMQKPQRARNNEKRRAEERMEAEKALRKQKEERAREERREKAKPNQPRAAAKTKTETP
jgi:Ca2+-binding EF-hand superfamily protein